MGWGLQLYQLIKLAGVSMPVELQLHLGAPGLSNDKLGAVHRGIESSEFTCDHSQNGCRVSVCWLQEP